jgi:3-deoxy-D-manno-octulosonate 8-phosphate phosphatase (KDO 8-P phosphatase)
MIKIPEIKLFISDVDGTLTDGGMYYTAEGEIMKKFNTRDAVGLRLLQERNIAVALITGEDSDIVRTRANKLNIEHVYSGITDKVTVLKQLCTELNIKAQQVAYVGDDINDLEIMQNVGLSFAVSDAESIILDTATIKLSKAGGAGGVREAANYVLENIV